MQTWHKQKGAGTQWGADPGPPPCLGLASLTGRYEASSQRSICHSLALKALSMLGLPPSASEAAGTARLGWVGWGRAILTHEAK